MINLFIRLRKCGLGISPSIGAEVNTSILDLLTLPISQPNTHIYLNPSVPRATNSVFMATVNRLDRLKNSGTRFI